MISHGAQVILAIAISSALCLPAWVWATSVGSFVTPRERTAGGSLRH